MDKILEAMSIAELKKFRISYKDNEEVVKVVDEQIDTKVKEIAREKARIEFTDVVTKMIGDLPHPEDIHNLYLRWAEVEVEDTEAEAVEVMLDGKPQMRKPTITTRQWVAEVNKGFRVGTRSGESATSKRAITVNKRDGQSLVFVGNFASASKACESLGIPTGGDSATRVLHREGYILDPYEGTDYTEKA